MDRGLYSRRDVLRLSTVALVGTGSLGCVGPWAQAVTVIVPLAVRILKVVDVALRVADVTLIILLALKEVNQQVQLEATLTTEQMQKLRQGAKLILVDQDGNKFEVPFHVTS